MEACMVELMSQTDFAVYILLFITAVLIFEDRFFSTKVRALFFVELGIVALILLGAQCEKNLLKETGSEVLPYLYAAVRSLRGIAIMVWLIIVLEGKKPFLRGLMIGCTVIYTLLYFVSIRTGWMFSYDGGTIGRQDMVAGIECALLCVATVVLAYHIRENEIAAGNRKSMGLVLVAPVILMISVVFAVMGNVVVFDNCLGASVCVYYFYLAGQTYKRDALTKLLNRYQLMYDLGNLENRQYEIALIDVDDFKLVNDEYGHDKGDEALKKVADIISKNVPSDCTLYRYGGDEFVLLSKKTSRDRLDELFTVINEQLKLNGLSVTSGWATHRPGDGTDKAITEADTKMYIVKRKKKSADIFDMMTGLYNTKGFIDALEVMRDNAVSAGRDVGLISLDVEHLGNINSAYGCLEGNLIIVNLVKVLREHLPDEALVGNLGGDEFAVACIFNHGDSDGLKRFTRELVKKIEDGLNFSGKEYSVDIDSSELLLEVSRDTVMEKAVEEVLYRKRSDRDNRRKTMATGETDAENELSEADEALVRQVFDENKFKYAFQPIVSAKTADIVAYEALMRGNTEPMVSPLTILAYARKYDRMYDVEKATYFNVFEQIRNSTGLIKNRRIFINTVPGYELTSKDFLNLSKKYGDLFEKIVVEITEQKELDDTEVQIIEERRSDCGFELAIDDFGSGCSNTNSLLRYMPQIIKLDRLLIAGIEQNPKKQYFVNSIITFAKQNDMKTLAEGVETEAEMRMAVRLGVDFIQGYYTARPEFEFLDAIPDEIRRAILTENIKGTVQAGRKIYVASEESELSLVHLALEEYTGLTIAVPNITLVGGYDFAADMCIKIKDGLDCKLYIRDIRINSVDDLPCLELGEYSNLTLYLEGENVMNQKGIYVPETANLTIKDSGTLKISAKGHDVYGIGSIMEQPFGGICFSHSGVVDIRVDGENMTGIGGGVYRGGLGICFESGTVNLAVSAVNAVGIGAWSGEVPITSSDATINVDFKVNKGVAIGSDEGKQDIRISSGSLNIVGNGTKMTGIGAIDDSDGKTELIQGAVNVKLNGQDIVLLGARSGAPDIRLECLHIDLKGEGNNVLGIGAYDGEASIFARSCTSSITINAANAQGICSANERTFIEDPKPVITINGNC